MRVVSTFLSFLAAVGLAQAVVGPGAVSGSTDVHDPTICKDGSGKYWLFSTAPGIAIRTSTDRTKWSYVGVVWPNGLAATNTYTGASNANLWAPDCTYVNGQFRLFYAASSFGSNKSGIFYATSKTGLPGSWTDKGVVYSSTTSSDFNAIDPNLFISSGGSWYLSFGSFWTGIKQIQIDSEGKTKSSTRSALATRSGSSTALEAPALYQASNGYFYLFTSWDKCCSGTSSTYNIRVGRSNQVNGNFVDKNGVNLLNNGGTQILASHDSIIGPGGQDVFDDGDGPILVYHYYTSSGSYLGINRLDFSSGWPVVV